MQYFVALIPEEETEYVITIVQYIILTTQITHIKKFVRARLPTAIVTAQHSIYYVITLTAIVITIQKRNILPRSITIYCIIQLHGYQTLIFSIYVRNN